MKDVIPHACKNSRGECGHKDKFSSRSLPFKYFHKQSLCRIWWVISEETCPGFLPMLDSPSGVKPSSGGWGLKTFQMQMPGFHYENHLFEIWNLAGMDHVYHTAIMSADCRFFSEGLQESQSTPNSRFFSNWCSACSFTKRNYGSDMRTHSVWICHRSQMTIWRASYAPEGRSTITLLILETLNDQQLNMW